MIAAFAHASRAIIGARDGQEDNHTVVLIGPNDTDQSRSGPDELLVVVADGMGGHVAGEEASRLACDAFVATYSEAAASGPDGGALASALDAANLAIDRRARQQSELRGMGCTLIGASFTVSGLRWISVGDSLIYLFRDERLSRLNEDHSMAPLLDDLAARGLMDRHEAAISPRRHHLRSALTGTEIEMIDHVDDPFELQVGDWLLFATDGIETLPTGVIEGIVRDNKNNSADRLIDALLEAVERASDPYQDNTTIVAVKPCADPFESAHATGSTKPLGGRNAI